MCSLRALGKEKKTTYALFANPWLRAGYSRTKLLPNLWILLRKSAREEWFGHDILACGLEKPARVHSRCSRSAGSGVKTLESSLFPTCGYRLRKSPRESLLVSMCFVENHTVTSTAYLRTDLLPRWWGSSKNFVTIRSGRGHEAGRGRLHGLCRRERSARWRIPEAKWFNRGARMEVREIQHGDQRLLFATWNFFWRRRPLHQDNSWSVLSSFMARFSR